MRLAAILLLPLALLACTLVEVDAPAGSRPPPGSGCSRSLAGVPAVIAIQRAFLNPACREPRRRGWFGTSCGGGDGDGGCGGCSD